MDNTANRSSIITGPSRSGAKPKNRIDTDYSPATAANRRTCQRCRVRKLDEDFEGKRRTCRTCRNSGRRKLRKDNKTKGLCGECSKPNETGCYRRDECRIKHNDDDVRRHELRNSNKQCVLCGADLVDKRRQRCKTFAKRNHDWCIDRRQIIKRHVIDHYGGACNCCGEHRLTMLTIDHSKGGGNEHRRRLGINGGGEAFYQWLIRSEFPDGFNLLCYNCNLSKYLNGGRCEHTRNNINE